MDWAHLQLQLAGDTQQRVSGLTHLEAFCQSADLDTHQAGELADACIQLLKDSNFKISHGSLQILVQAAQRHAAALRPFLDSLLPSVVGKLGDMKAVACSASEGHLQALSARFHHDRKQMQMNQDTPIAKVPSAQSLASQRDSRPSESLSGALSDQTSEAAIIGSEHELRATLDTIAGQLDAQSDWNKRIAALQRFEALVKGGAAMFPGFLEMLQRMREPLILQLADRRSAVSRQTCHLIGELAAAMQSSFEPMALILFPELLKTLIITVQVMADAADACCHTIIQQCLSLRLMVRTCDTIKTDKNAKLRQHCSIYLLQMVTGWPASSWQRCLPALETALKASCQDAQSSTRETGRATFAAYAAALPSAAQDFLAKLDAGLQSRLRQALHSAPMQPLTSRSQHTSSALERPQTSARATAPQAPPPLARPLTAPSRACSHLASGPSPRPVQAGATSLPLQDRTLPRRASTAAPRDASNHYSGVTSASISYDDTDEVEASSARGRRIGRTSLGGAALRIHLPHREELGNGAVTPAAQRPAARRVSMMHQLPPASAATSQASRLNHRAAPAHPALSALPRAQHGEAPGSTWGVPAYEPPSIAVAVSRALVHFEDSKSADWKDKAEALEELGQALARLAEERAAGDAGPAPETVVEAANTVLAACAHALSLEALLPAMTKAVGATKAVRPRLSILHFFIHQASQCKQSHGASTHPIRTWVARVAGLTTDKLSELRRGAADALAAMYHLSQDALLSSILTAPPSQQLAVRQALSSLLPTLDSELQQASIAYNIGFQLGSPARRSPPSPAGRSHTSLRSSPAHTQSNASSPESSQVRSHQLWRTDSQTSEADSQPVMHISRPAPAGMDLLRICDADHSSWQAANTVQEPEQPNVGTDSLQARSHDALQDRMTDEPAAQRRMASNDLAGSHLGSVEMPVGHGKQHGPMVDARLPDSSSRGMNEVTARTAEAMPLSRASEWVFCQNQGSIGPSREQELAHQRSTGLRSSSDSGLGEQALGQSGPTAWGPGNRERGHEHAAGSSHLLAAQAPEIPNVQQIPDPTAQGGPSGQAQGPRQPLAAKHQQPADQYAGLLPISPMSGQRWPGQENAGPAANRGVKLSQEPGQPLPGLQSTNSMQESQPSLATPLTGQEATAFTLQTLCANLRSGVDSEIEHACICSRQLASQQAGWLESSLQSLLPAIIVACCHPSSLAAGHAGRVLEAIESQALADACVDVMRPDLIRLSGTSSAAEAAPLQAIIKSVTRLVPRLLRPEACANQILPSLFRAFHHPTADVRKGVVFCLVEFWQRAGDSLTPALSALTPSQHKLVTIYMNRRQKL
ncbi:hypothetical protein WJX84_010387 [Apatococcus fuscideae]|uniref:TOG domain-containing protein n=1 Tax=Apatococcus fuscideae TaxID=2026836 RepID=A0AAW1SYM5_9CHLO